MGFPVSHLYYCTLQMFPQKSHLALETHFESENVKSDLCTSDAVRAEVNAGRVLTEEERRRFGSAVLRWGDADDIRHVGGLGRHLLVCMAIGSK